MDLITIDGLTGNYTITSYATPLSAPRGFLAGAATNGGFVFAGGLNGTVPSAVIDIFYPASNATQRLNLTEARWGIAVAVTGNYVVLAGGTADGVAPLSNPSQFVDVLIFNITQFYAVPANLIGIGLAYLAAAVPSVTDPQVISVFGGQGISVPINNQLLFFTSNRPVNNTNSPRTLSGPRVSHVGLAPTAGRAIMAGGSTNGFEAYPPAAVATVDLFLPTVLNAVTTSLYQATTWAAGGSLPSDGVGFIAGGYVYNATGTADIALSLVQIYDRGHWAMHQLDTARWFHAVGCTQGVCAVAGGTNDASSYLNSVEVYTSFYIPRPLQATTPPPTTTAPPTVITTTPVATQGCVGRPPVDTAVCVNGVWVVPDNTTTTTTNVTIIGNQTVIIDGTLILLPGSITIVQFDPNSPQGAPIQVTGAILVDGVLQIVLTDSAENSTVIPIVGGTGDINGTFTGVTVTSPDRCQDANGYLQKDTVGTLSVLITVANKCRSKGLSRGAIAGIVVGSVLLVAAAVAIGVVILKKKMPNHQLFNTDKTGDDGWR